MKSIYLTSRTFQSLTIHDLLEARSRHHDRIATQYRNVVGTAIGFFRFRDHDERSHNSDAAQEYFKQRLGLHSQGQSAHHSERTLENSRIYHYSPPCILIFVDSWLTSEEFRTSPQKIIPSFLETNDARLVPTCVILAKKDEASPEASTHLNFPSHMFGGGFIATSEVQGREHLSSVGCLVTDGDRTFVLTNRHVTGDGSDRVISTYVNGEKVRLGTTCGASVGKVPSAKVYDKWPGKESYSNVDAGLILVDDVLHWTTQVYGVGKLLEPFRINFDSALETCIGLKLKAFGGASGSLSGEVVGLFYRYKALGGYDFVADFLIGPRTSGDHAADKMRTMPGDSGTMWVVDVSQGAEDGSDDGTKKAKRSPKRTEVRSYQPFALQWGGQVTLSADQKQKFNFALATSLESACRLLSVDVVRDWNIGHPEYWGEMGHYSIGLKACGLISDESPNLAKLLSLNSENIGFDDTILRDPNEFHKKKANYKNVPLADVADDVWRNPSKYGGRSGVSTNMDKNNDANNHFADMDQPGAGTFAGKTLMQMYKDDPDTLTVDTWTKFYDALKTAGDEKTNAGALPFRVWQGFDLMVDYLNKDDLIGYFCVAGIMAHYVGDASQPLHISRLHHGDPDHQTSVSKAVHSIYESTMLDNHAPDVLEGLNERITGEDAKADSSIPNGKEAASKVVDLMIRVYENLNPQEIIDTYSQGHNAAERAELLWNAHKGKTMDNMALCCSTLASLWESAWKVGGGEAKFPEPTKPFDYNKDLRPKYKPSTFYPSESLSLMGAYCREPGAAPEEVDAPNGKPSDIAGSANSHPRGRNSASKKMTKKAPAKTTHSVETRVSKGAAKKKTASKK